jgi:hypothetical protein
LLAVTAIVLEWGGDEDVAIAALLHDAVEDQGGIPTADLIRGRFGDSVADIVLACSDSTNTDAERKAPWEERKLRHLATLSGAGREVALVTAADKPRRAWIPYGGLQPQIYHEAELITEAEAERLMWDLSRVTTPDILQCAQRRNRRREPHVR